MSSESGFSGIVPEYVRAVDPTEVSRRLKAARWMAGGIDNNGKPKSLTVEELVELPALAEARISKNRIEELEQAVAKYPIRAFECSAVERALGLEGWFAENPADARRADVLDLLVQALVDLGLVRRPSPEAGPSAEDDTDHPPKAAGGDGR